MTTMRAKTSLIVPILLMLCLVLFTACSSGDEDWCLSGGLSTTDCGQCCYSCQVDFFGPGVHRCW